MSDEQVTDLNFVGRQLKQVLGDLGALGEDVAVLTAVTMRLDGTVSGLVNEVRALHSQHGRMANRVRALEGAGEAQP
jgi:hypothetical protein